MLESKVIIPIIKTALDGLNLHLLVNVIEALVLLFFLYYAIYGVLKLHFPEKLQALVSLFKETGDHYVLPKKVFLVRHGQSLGNIKETSYETTPDWKIPLTAKGKEEAVAAGMKIKEMCGDTPVIVYFSPYKRTKSTMKHILRAFHRDQIYVVQEEPRIREQDFGNFQNINNMKKFKKERLMFSRFFYRFPMGESGADVYDRVSSFMESLFRLFHRESDKDYNLIIVSHGLTMRIILMRWFRWTVQEFETLVNPRNAVPVVMERTKKATGTQYLLTPESWQMLHAYENVPEKAKTLKIRRRQSRTKQTLKEIMQQSDTETERDFETKSPTRLPSMESIKEERSRGSRSSSEPNDGLMMSHEDFAELMEQEKDIFQDRKKLARINRRGSAIAGYTNEIENGEAKKFNRFIKHISVQTPEHETEEKATSPIAVE